MIHIRQARPGDEGLIQEILQEVSAWLDASRQVWPPEEASWAELSRHFAVGDFHIAALDGGAAGCMALVDRDGVFWPDVPPGESLFIHKLGIRACARHCGVGDALMAFAKAEGKRRGAASLRLDCLRERDTLRGFYERHGFRCVREAVCAGGYGLEEYDAAFYEYTL